MNANVERSFVTETLRALVRIDSVNPAFSEAAPGEAEIAGYVADLLDSLGLEVAAHEPEPGRASVVGRLPGRGGGRSLMLNAHYDTVGVEGMAAPFSAEIREGRVYGRGAYDMKGSLAACIGAVRRLLEEDVRLDGDLLVAAVADEEAASVGTADLIGRYWVDAAIVTEPTSLEICLAHKGFLWAEIETRGRAAHGSRPDLGIDAIMCIGRVLSELGELGRELGRREPHPLLGHASLHAATIRGGTGLSTYAERCRLGVERRTVPGETEEAVLAELGSILDRLSRTDPSFRAALTHRLTREPFETTADRPIVRALAESVGEVLGRAPAYTGEGPWMDSALLAAAGVDTVVIGPHGEGAHAPVEWVDLESVHQLTRILANTARRYCAGPRRD